MHSDAPSTMKNMIPLSLNDTAVMQYQDGLRHYNYGKNKRRRATNNHECGGDAAQRLLTMENGCTGNDCDRAYYLYLPLAACDNGGDLEILPLVFAVHCLGCTPTTMMHWIEIAEANRFVLVIPEGLKNSFNGQHCCGYALDQKVDDVGFLQAIIQELDQEIPFVSSDLTYALGWSNGGYLVSYAARLFRAIAPISGYEVDITPNPDRPTAIFLHHAQDDNFVRPTGCCTDASMPSCCCRLSTYMETCTSVELKMKEWASPTLNDCRDSSSGTAGRPQMTMDQPDAVTCYTYPNCQANTTYCIHQHKAHFNHPSFQAAFPMANEIADFFARHACETYGGGQWIIDTSTGQSRCICPGTTTTATSQTRQYCPPWEGSSSNTTPKPTLTVPSSPSPSFVVDVEQAGATLNETSSGHRVALFSFSLISSGLFLFMVHYIYSSSRRRSTYKGFDKVSTVELRSM